MNLGEKYSKSILRKYDLVPIYYPGTEVSVGDIISYDTNILGNAKKPFGTFQIKGNLINGETYNLGLNTIVDKQSKPYNFVSENEVTVTAAIAGELPNIANGDIKFNFGKEGSILLYGVNGKETRIADQFKLESLLQPFSKDRDWNDFYIVTSVIICEKALIYQSNENNGSLYVSASAKNIKIAQDGIDNIDADVSFDVKWKTKQAFSRDWTDNVAVFMKLVQFRRNKIRDFEKAANDNGNKNEFEITEINYQTLLES